MSSESTDANATTENEFPVAKVPVAKVKDAAPLMLRSSRMWWLTLVCLILAIALAWQSMPKKGQRIAIHFPQGHGLKAGDTLRYRGIKVGTVATINLNDGLSGVDVVVELQPDGGALDREGTRFWIVRPKISLTEVSGLETAIGAKYIGVSPGDPSGPQRTEFEGLSAAPPDELDRGGLVIVLRSDQRYGTSPGAPVTWRGVKAGKVLSVNLSPDARHVNITARIDRSYRKLVRSSSKFWVNSGFGVDIGLSGIKLNAESLTTILQGGISFVTLADDNNKKSVRDGHVFSLSAEADDDWLEAAANVPLIDFDLPETVLIRGKRVSSTFGIKHTKEFTQHGLVIADGQQTLLLTAPLPLAGETELADFEIDAASGEPKPISGVTPTTATLSASGMIAVPLENIKPAARLNQIRNPTSIEDCLVVRSAIVDGRATPVIQAIDAEQLSAGTTGWLVQNDLNFSEWNGAPVVAMSDGKVIGILLTDSGSPIVSIYSDTTESSE